MWYPEYDNESRTQRWLRELGRYRATPDALELLDRCLNKAELQFAVTLLEGPGWFRLDDNSLATTDIAVTPRARIGEYSISFLVTTRKTGERWGCDIVPASSGKRAVDARRAQAIVDELGPRYLVLDAEQAMDAAKHIHEVVRKAAALEGRYSLQHFKQLVAPGVLWRPLDKQFKFKGSDAGATRAHRLYFWLREERDVELAPREVSFLAQCEWWAMVDFLVPILTATSWEIRGAVAYHAAIGVAVRTVLPGVSSFEYDFVIGRLRSQATKPTIVEVRKPQSWDLPREVAHQRAREHAARSSGYHYMLIEPADARVEGEWWSTLLKDWKDEHEKLRARFSEPNQPAWESSELRM
jgi:hypothetical protein